MAALYACHFSNGHIKVGRSINPMARIAQHEARVSCLGVELVEHFVAECVGHVASAEAALIERCDQAASRRNKNEWFEGLDFGDVCEWAEQLSQTNFENQKEGDPCSSFRDFYTALSPEKKAEFAKMAGTTTGYCHQLAHGGKRIELGLADVLVTISDGALTLDSLNLTDRAQHQREARSQPVLVISEKKGA